MQPSPTATQYRSPKVILLIVGALILLGLWYSFAKATTPPTATPQPTTQSASQIVGQQRHLTNPGGTAVAVFDSQTSLDTAVRAAVIGDRIGLAQAVNNHAVQVPTGSSVLVLDTGFIENKPAKKVRVLSTGDAGWVMDDAITS